MGKKAIYLLILIFGFVAKTIAQPIQVKLSSDSAAYFIGDKILVKLTAEHIPDVIINWSTIRSLGSDAEILQQSSVDTLLKTEGKISEQITISLISFLEDSFSIQPIEIIYSQGNKKQQYSISTVPLILKIKKIVVDTDKEPKPITDIEKIPLSFFEKLILGSILLLIIVSTLLAIRYYLIKKRKKQFALDNLSAEQIAFSQIEKLQNKKLWQSAHYKSYYNELSVIVRTYLKNFSGINSLPMSTNRLLEAVYSEEKILPKPLVKQLLDESDLVKFANNTVEKNNEEKLITNSKRIFTNQQSTDV